jgi:phage/plasmid primase-like uncharacterized protein
MSATARRLETIDALKARADIVEIVGRYVSLKRRGHEFWGLCPFHGERTPSFKVDQDRQRFICFGCNARGDALDFLARIEGLSLVEAIRRLRELAGDRMEPVRPAAEAEVEAKREEEVRKFWARRIWAKSAPIVDALPLRYLREVRGLHGWRNDTLRWHPHCPWSGVPWGRTGCIVAAVTDPAGDLAAIHRIKPSLTGKAERKALGPIKGGACRLFPAKGHQLLIAEGIEDALAGRMLTGLPAWAAISAGNMGDLVLPEQYHEVLIIADGDENRMGLENARALAVRLRQEGRYVEVRLPAAAKDANDVLRARRAA